MTSIEWRTTPVASATELVHRLGRPSWLPTWWPEELGAPSFLVLERDEVSSRYVVWSSRGSDGLVLASSHDDMHEPAWALEPVPDSAWPTWRVMAGSERWLIELPEGERLHLAGTLVAAAGLRVVESLALMTY